MGLKDVGAKLPPGFRFHPSDEELVCHYLRNKIKAKSDHYDGGDNDEAEAVKTGDLVEIDLHICEPWQLPEVAKLNANEWYFFSFRDRKYATGYRTNRATTSGYWKATGKDRMVVDPRTKEMVGMRKTLVFYKNRAPNGTKTTWIMHEFRLDCPHMPPKEDWVLCRVFNKSKALVTQDNPIPKFCLEEDTAFNNFNCAPHYTNLLPPPPPSFSSSSPLSSTIIDLDHQEMMMKTGCSIGQGESFLGMIYEEEKGGIVGSTEENYGCGNMYWEMTGGGGTGSDDLRFGIHDTLAFH